MTKIRSKNAKSDKFEHSRNENDKKKFENDRNDENSFKKCKI